MKEKLRELAEKHQIPETLLIEAIQLEKEKVILQNRRMAPVLVQMIERYADSAEHLQVKERDYDA